MTWVRPNGAQADAVGPTATSKRVPFTSTSASPVATMNRPPSGTLATSASSVPLSTSNRWVAPSAVNRTRDEAPTRSLVPVSSASKRCPAPGTRTDVPAAIRSPRIAGRTPSGASIAAPEPSTSATDSFVSAGAPPRATPPAVARSVDSVDAQATPADRQQHRCRRGRHAPPDPRHETPPPTGVERALDRRDARRSIRQRRRRSRFVVGRALLEHLGRESRVPRVLLGSPHPCPSVRSSSAANSGSAATRACRSLRPRTRRLWAAAGLIDMIWATSRRS